MFHSIAEQEFAAHPAEYLDAVRKGGCLTISNGGRELAIILPILGTGESRQFGIFKGEFEVPEDFNGPLPSDVLDAFEGLS